MQILSEDLPRVPQPPVGIQCPENSTWQDPPVVWYDPPTSRGAEQVDDFKCIVAGLLETLLCELVRQHEARVGQCPKSNHLRQEGLNSNGTGEQDSLLDASSPGSGQRAPARDRPKNGDFSSETTKIFNSSKSVTADTIKSSKSDKVSWIDRIHIAHRSTDNLDEEQPPRLSQLKNSKSLLHTTAVASTAAVRTFVLSQTFELIAGAVIVANTGLMALQQQYVGYDSGYAVRPGEYPQPADRTWPGAEDVFGVFDIVFNILFSGELLLRFYTYGIRSIRMGWMWFDTIIVVSGFADSLIGAAGVGIDPTMIRLVRLVRLVRVLKVFKAMESFDSLFLLLKAIRASVGALFWSLVLLVLLQIACGLFLCQVLQGFIIDENNDVIARDKVFAYFGTFFRTMLSMAEITLANWVPPCRTLVEEVHESFALFFMAYRCVFCFSILRVINAVFITETNRVLANDDELHVMKTTREKAVFAKKFRQVLASVDRDDDGIITWTELREELKKQTLSAGLTTIGVSKTDLEKLFWLTQVDEEAQTEKMMSMVSELKGQAKTVDLFNLFKVIVKLDDKICRALNVQDDEETDALKKLGNREDLIEKEECENEE